MRHSSRRSGGRTPKKDLGRKPATQGRPYRCVRILLSSEAIITTDSEEKHHGYTSQEVSQEVWRQKSKQAEWIGNEIRKARSKEFEPQAAGVETWCREEIIGETTGAQKELGQA